MVICEQYLLDATRKDLRKECPEQEAFKHIRWRLLKSPEKLSEDEKKALKVAFEVSPALQEVYELRAALKTVFDTDMSKVAASEKVEKWQEKAKKLENVPISKFLKTLNNWKDKVLNFFTNDTQMQLLKD